GENEVHSSGGSTAPECPVERTFFLSGTASNEHKKGSNNAWKNPPRVSQEQRSPRCKYGSPPKRARLELAGCGHHDCRAAFPVRLPRCTTPRGPYAGAVPAQS